ncbi:MAG TPA: response regulator, partial [Candidatus Acidoferrales bacterium]|nr:response regulator [Candidatus Acidoferrales bacterium]
MLPVPFQRLADACGQNRLLAAGGGDENRSCGLRSAGKCLCFWAGMADSARARYQILVVDDEPTVCKAIQMMLRYYGHEVQTANDGETALALFKAGQFDLIITDYLMPEMKGDQLVTLMKRCRPGQRIIMVTAFAEDFL